jgi:hypothetical protein
MFRKREAMEVPDNASRLYDFPALRFAVATPLVR